MSAAGGACRCLSKGGEVVAEPDDSRVEQGGGFFHGHAGDARGRRGPGKGGNGLACLRDFGVRRLNWRFLLICRVYLGIRLPERPPQAPERPPRVPELPALVPTKLFLGSVPPQFPTPNPRKEPGNMLVEFDFAVTQTAYVKAAMDEIPAFRPEGETPTPVQARVDSATVPRLAYITNHGCHRWCPRIAPDLDRDAARRLRGFRRAGPLALPQESRGRGALRAAAERRSDLPGDNDARGGDFRFLCDAADGGRAAGGLHRGPGTTTLELAGFNAMMTTAGGADTSIPAVDQDFQAAEGAVHVNQADLEEFLTAALELGRSQFEEGSAEREIIDAIPTAPDGSGPVEPSLPLPIELQNVAMTSGQPGIGEVVFNWNLSGAQELVSD